MNSYDPDSINLLIGEYSDLQEMWESRPESFDWTKLDALARKGVHAYNEGAGPSFHALALDGIQHSEFHERFLDSLLKAGFDPFKLARPGTGVAPVPVIDHAGLAEAAFSNPSSARMRAALMEAAHQRFSSLADDGRLSQDAYEQVEACAESIPLDLLNRLTPELAGYHPGDARRGSVDPVEGYLTSAEVIVEGSHVPYG